MDLRTNTRGIFTGNRVIAKYHSDVEPVYCHNPYIEALPPVFTADQVARRIRRKPVYSEEQRLWSPERRIESVQTIANYVEPLPVHLDLAQRFSRMIRNGYLARNPLPMEWLKQIHSGFPELDWDADEGFVPLIRSTASGFCIIGTSGVGKTTAVESILSLYPQVIVHTEYYGQAFDQQQLVWLKLECPFDASIKGLCLNFFQAIDAVLGTKYYQRLGKSKRTTDELLTDMAMLAGELGIGVLVIDEIQRLSEAKSGGASKMLNFFVQLANTIGVPVVLVGTFKALHFMRGDLAQARRGAGQGDLIWANMPNDEVWDYFIEGLWNYQWTNVKSPLTPAIRKVLYEESQGITDFAVKLYMLAQWQVIGQDDERITATLIRRVARENLKLAKPILDALRNNDFENSVILATCSRHLLYWTISCTVLRSGFL
ncbi:MAG: ATP-binding protein [Alicyclobacillus macrosporangiidus]|uniref:ATP-binding protein n=1 Tax=Alicyclobacillus macrosporangiidus TaxID=392015 RepID=UPI0026EF756E|nr:ATP-binding protein [Alicyclobacillus macrosporangiidus]MCL6597491.1 ATP-binding protein [Alicyclobacillus macrosporangiidus]